MGMKEFLDSLDYNALNGSDLAYIGDAYYELWMRLYLLNKGYTKPNDLHRLCIKYVSAVSHAKVAKKLEPIFTEKEIDVFKRGRNYNYRHRSKGSNLSQYLQSSGFEAVIGYLYISNQEERLEFLLKRATEIIEEENE